MKLLQLKIQTSHEVEEALTEYFTNVLDANGVEVRRRQDFLDAKTRQQSEVVEFADIKNLPKDIELIAYFPEDTDVDILLEETNKKISELESYGLQTGNKKISTAYIADQDWNEAWKKYYHVVRVTHDLTIVPEWIDYRPKSPDEKLIFLDPGLSFGTGTHITTQLALLALEKVVRQDQDILDLGTGSGILSIAAEKLGANSILATDIDEQSMTAAKINISLNNSTNIKLKKSNLFNQIEQKYDTIVANILTEILLQVVPELDKYLNPGGKVIFSGIDIDQLSKLTTQIKNTNFKIELQMQQERWVALVLARNGEK